MLVALWRRKLVCTKRARASHTQARSHAPALTPILKQGICLALKGTRMWCVTCAPALSGARIGNRSARMQPNCSGTVLQLVEIAALLLRFGFHFHSRSRDGLYSKCVRRHRSSAAHGLHGRQLEAAAKSCSSTMLFKRSCLQTSTSCSTYCSARDEGCNADWWVGRPRMRHILGGCLMTTNP